MKIVLDDEDLQPLIHRVIEATLESIEADRMTLEGRIAFTEQEAAALLGVQRHTLRDARLRGEVTGSKVGKRIVYSKEELRAFLQRKRLK